MFWLQTEPDKVAVLVVGDGGQGGGVHRLGVRECVVGRWEGDWYRGVVIEEKEMKVEGCGAVYIVEQEDSEPLRGGASQLELPANSLGAQALCLSRPLLEEDSPTYTPAKKAKMIRTKGEAQGDGQDVKQEADPDRTMQEALATALSSPAVLSAKARGLADHFNGHAAGPPKPCPVPAAPK